MTVAQNPAQNILLNLWVFFCLFVNIFHEVTTLDKS